MKNSRRARAAQEAAQGKQPPKLTKYAAKMAAERQRLAKFKDAAE